MNVKSRAAVVGAIVATLFIGVIVARELGRYRARVTGPSLSSVLLCRTAGVELIDDRCNARGECTRRSARLTWTRGEGTLFIGEGETETRTELERAELDRLKELLRAVETLDTDDPTPCYSFRASGSACPPGTSTQTITTECGAGGWSDTFGPLEPFRERFARKTQWCPVNDNVERARCLAPALWQVAFATERADRVSRVLTELRDAAAAK